MAFPSINIAISTVLTWSSSLGSARLPRPDRSSHHKGPAQTLRTAAVTNPAPSLALRPLTHRAWVTPDPPRAHVSVITGKTMVSVPPPKPSFTSPGLWARERNTHMTKRVGGGGVGESTRVLQVISCSNSLEPALGCPQQQALPTD